MSQVIKEIQDRVCYLTLNRPEKRNALNPELIGELKKIIEGIENDPSLKVVVIQGSGKAFCAGADLSYLKHLQSYSYEENLADSNNLKDLFKSIYVSPKVFIAKVTGHAIAGGCGLATVCDYAFSVPEAKFGYTEVRIGFVPALVMIFLIRKIGEQKARDLMLSGRLIEASEALKKGLINEIVDALKMDDHVKEFAKELVEKNSQESMAQVKKMMAELPKMDLETSFNYAAEMNARSRETDDCKKGIDSFLSKTPLTW